VGKHIAGPKPPPSPLFNLMRPRQRLNLSPRCQGFNFATLGPMFER